MIIVEIETLFGSFRRSFARSYGETYNFAPPSTVYGMLLSLVGERQRSRHIGVKLAFAYRTIPQVSVRLRQSSPLKYGLIDGSSGWDHIIDTVETLCGINFLCWIDSQSELSSHQDITFQGSALEQTLETRVQDALLHPENSSRFGVLSLGLSDELINEIKIVSDVTENCYRLKLSANGLHELPVWVDHVGAKGTRWMRYDIDSSPTDVRNGPEDTWTFTSIGPIDSES